MSGFRASEAVEALDYDFTDLQLADEEQAAILADAKGTVPEPSQARLDAYFDTLLALIRDSGVGELPADPTPQQVMGVMAGMPEGTLERLNDGVLDAVADLCGGSPTREQLGALPPRVRQAFIGWLSGKLANPQMPQPATRASAAAPNGAGSST